MKIINPDTIVLSRVCSAPSGRVNRSDNGFPGAMPRAIALSPVGADGVTFAAFGLPTSSAPTGQTEIARGKAQCRPGSMVSIYPSPEGAEYRCGWRRVEMDRHRDVSPLQGCGDCKPRAMPWDVTFCPVGAGDACGALRGSIV